MKSIFIGACALGLLAGIGSASAQQGTAAARLTVQAGFVGGGIGDGSGKWEPMGNPTSCGPARSASYNVQFAQPFAAAPVVTASLSQADVSKEADWRLRLQITNVTGSGFTLLFVTWCDTKAYGAMSQWTAFGN